MQLWLRVLLEQRGHALRSQGNMNMPSEGEGARSLGRQPHGTHGSGRAKSSEPQTPCCQPALIHSLPPLTPPTDTQATPPPPPMCQALSGAQQATVSDGSLRLPQGSVLVGQKGLRRPPAPC